MEERACSGGFMSTSLQKAATHGDARLVAQALECTATNLDAIGADGRTALMLAAMHGHLSVCAALCDAGADLDVCDGAGQSAEALAAASGHAQCAKLLASEATKRRALWSTIMGTGAAGPTSSIEPREDVMAKLLAEAGLPKGAAESPF